MMNTDLDGSAAMDQDPNMAQTNGYGSDNWVSLSPYSQSPYDNSPMNEYALKVYRLILCSGCRHQACRRSLISRRLRGITTATTTVITS